VNGCAGGISPQRHKVAKSSDYTSVGQNNKKFRLSFLPYMALTAGLVTTQFSSRKKESFNLFSLGATSHSVSATIQAIQVVTILTR
jgi:hypothetical protein